MKLSGKKLLSIIPLLFMLAILFRTPVSAASYDGAGAAGSCTVTFYNNSGTKPFSGKQMTVPAGTTIKLPDFKYANYVNYGWTDVAGSSLVQYKVGDSFTVTRDTNLYVIRYIEYNLIFKNPSGSTNSSMRALNQTVIKGTKVKLPTVPTVTGYANLGWSTKKNAKTATYSAGKTITVKKNITLYAVRKKMPYTVKFTNTSGTSTNKAYTSLNQYVAKNATVKLPEVPKLKGYQSVGWTTTKNGTEPLYKPGDKVKVTGNMTFYAVRTKSKYYTVTFYLGNGKTNSAYKKLQKKVEENTVITFPSVPSRTGYVNMGWSGKKNATTASKATTYKVTRNVKFYAVQKKAVSIVLHNNDGSVYKTVAVGKGNYFKLPSIENPVGYTFMGWARKPYQTTNAEFQAGVNVLMNSQLHLYAVMFNRATEPDLSASSIRQQELMVRSKYKKIIFVGDSRTVMMRNTLYTLADQSGVSLTSGTDFVCQSGTGLNWLKSQGYDDLLSVVDSAAKGTAVVFNFGVNDLQNLSGYVTYMNSIAKTLKSKGCDLYYMSLNPFNSKMLKTAREESVLRNFNKTIKSSLKDYKYIDVYSYLMQTGYGTDSGTGYDDGLHYTTKTYKRIYYSCLSKINAM